jgi:hypothetical protein
MPATATHDNHYWVTRQNIEIVLLQTQALNIVPLLRCVVLLSEEVQLFYLSNRQFYTIHIHSPEPTLVYHNEANVILWLLKMMCFTATWPINSQLSYLFLKVKNLLCI